VIDVAAQHARRGLDLDENLRKKRNIENDYEQDIELMRTGNFSGIRGIANQDHAATETMGAIVDRSKEHLGTSDLPLIHMRRLLLKTVREFQEGIDPQPFDNDSLKNLYSEGLYAPKEKTIEEALPLQDQYKPVQNVTK
jgi:hypothetical protein